MRVSVAYKALRSSMLVRQFMKYGVTGLFNTLVLYVIYATLVHAEVNSGLSLAIGYSCGIFLSYIMNSYWTFRTKALCWQYMWKFALVNLIVLALSECSLWAILRFLVASAYVAQVINTVVIAVIAFLANRFMAFSQSEPIVSPVRK